MAGSSCTMTADAIAFRRPGFPVLPGRTGKSRSPRLPSVQRALPTSRGPFVRPNPRTLPSVSEPTVNARQRATVDGRFFRVGSRKFFPKGVVYGPFPPNRAGEPFPERESVSRDFAQIVQLGANLLRIYHVPPRWFLDLAAEHELKVLVDVPWNKHLCFLENARSRKEAIEAVRSAARACAAHPAVFALSVVNEIPADIVRWSGGSAVCDFIDDLVAVARSEDPECLCTFGNFPPTEFLGPRTVDFFCWNVYLHQQRSLENYLARLQMLADTKPMMLGEFGIDTVREGEERQAEVLGWSIETAFRSGCAGAVVFSYTDEWFKDHRLVEDWKFGLTRADRSPRPALEVVRAQFAAAPYFPLTQTPRVSVVVASYNGAATLKACLQSLEQLNYPNYEVILVDDGSTDSTPQIASLFPGVRTIRHPKNEGLSVARNTGIYAATGDIVAFTDSDCRADEDWLHFLVGDLLNSRFAGIGGHNLLPQDDSPVAAAVMVSPGGPAHVMLTDRLAEHIPGCNMAFYKWALMEIGGFDPVYRKAGDDVDVCWRLQQRGYRIGFSPGGFVWHYRRNTVRAYLRQQGGYGEAEAMLERRHPENFNRFGGSRWQGRIYSPAKIGVETRGPVIYHGLFGSAFFQSIYSGSPSLLLTVVTSLEYYVLVTLPLLTLGSVVPHLTAFGFASLGFSVALCVIAAWQADLARGRSRVWSRPLVALLFLLQPLVRGGARHRGHLRGQQTRLSDRENLESMSLAGRGVDLSSVAYWSDTGVDRLAFLARVLERLDQRGWPNKPDSGWSRFDVEVYGSRWARLQLITVSEFHSGGREVLRCRLNGEWSFFARATFWSMAGLLLVIIGFLSRDLGWSPGWKAWTLLLVLPLLAWRLNAARLDLLRVFATFLDGCAKDFGMVKLEGGARR